MITLSSQDDLKAAKEALEAVKNSYPALFEKLVDVINLTRALQFKYQYLGCLITDEDPGNNAPCFVHGSVLRLYKKEFQSLKDDSDSAVLKQAFIEFKHISYAKVSLLAIGMTPESLLGASTIK
ncbi:hypothetical protein [Peribacillus cavernae]|nr:hypothetical protein [Peribacillus cavernae]MDQ0219742.1 hypothetical protein [Peribacillus cavernae]